MTDKHVTGLTNGTYKARAWVKSSGGQNSVKMTAKSYGGSELSANIPASSSWTKIEIPTIIVTNGQCQIDFYSDANAGNTLSVGKVELYK